MAPAVENGNSGGGAGLNVTSAFHPFLPLRPICVSWANARRMAANGLGGSERRICREPIGNGFCESPGGFIGL